MVGKGQVDTNDNVAYRESRFQISLTMAKNELATSLVRTRDLNCNGFSTKNFIVGLRDDWDDGLLARHRPLYSRTVDYEVST